MEMSCFSGKNILVENVGKRYGATPVYENFSLGLEEGKITCLLGASGCGKTTLLNMLAGLTPYEGKIENVPERISYIFQEERLLPNLTVKQNVALVLGKNADGKKISEMLGKVELSGKENAYPSELSGGQAQRVSIARAFAYPSGLILMDEPFSSLDTALKIRLIGVFCRLWQEERRTAVFVTHDAEEAYMLAHRAVLLKDGKIAADIGENSPVPRPYGENSPFKQKILAEMLKSE